MRRPSEIWTFSRRKSQKSFYAINANIAIYKLIFVFQPNGVFDFDSIDSKIYVSLFIFFFIPPAVGVPA